MKQHLRQCEQAGNAFGEEERVKLGLPALKPNKPAATSLDQSKILNKPPATAAAVATDKAALADEFDDIVLEDLDFSDEDF